ncbi:MAG: zinc transporter, partial [Arenicella sp.]
ERSQIIKDDLVNALSDRLNRNLYVLSVITAIFLPLGFLTGLFGINIGGMPGVDNNMAFSIFSIGLIVVVFIQIILFKLFKWL